MNHNVLILILEAVLVYFLVLLTHSLRRRVGLSFFYGLLGALTAVMSWVTDAGAFVQLGDIKFMVGSAVFYTALLLGVFVVYVFDGPRATRIAIITIAGVSVITPLIAVALHFQMSIADLPPLGFIPVPSLRINLASVLTTMVDLVFLAVAWEFLGRSRFRQQLGVRAFLTLLGVMWLDVILFNAGAFLGTPEYLSILQGTFISRLTITLFAWPFLYFYIAWQTRKSGVSIDNRPVLAVLREVVEVRAQLSVAQQEIERRRAAELEKQAVIDRLETTLAHVRVLEGLLPVCSGCKRIRLDPADHENGKDQWITLEEFVHQKTDVQFSHGLCRDCVTRIYPDLPPHVIDEDTGSAFRLQTGEEPA